MNQQSKIRVAFQGSRGAYSEMALINFFDEKACAVGFDLSEQVCESVRDGECQFGILPVENSIVGNIDVNVDLLFEHDVYIIGEYYLPIKHCLLAPQGIELEAIKQVYSHPAALAQCRDFLNRYKLQAIPEFDTAGSCEKILMEKTQDKATIASGLCAEYYGLAILKQNIQKVRNNVTRFFIFVRSDSVPDNIKAEKITMAFGAKHAPGSLIRCLQTFSTHGVNMTKLESRPVPENPFVYTFFVDLEGSPDSSSMQACMQDLKKEAQTIKILGSYPIGKVPNSKA